MADCTVNDIATQDENGRLLTIRKKTKAKTFYLSLMDSVVVGSNIADLLHRFFDRAR